MIHILATVQIENLSQFIAVFSTEGAAARRKHGSAHSQMFRVPGQENTMRILFQWSSREAFEGFLADGDVRAVMQRSGTVGRPEFVFLEAFAALPS